MLIRQLPIDSRTHSRTGDRWSTTNYQLGALNDHLLHRRLEAAQLAGAKQVPKFTPTWRPGDPLPDRMGLTKAEAVAILPGMKTKAVTAGEDSHV